MSDFQQPASANPNTQPVPAAPQATAAPKPKPPEPPAEFQEKQIASLDAASLLRLLQAPGSSLFEKAKACMRAGELGATETIPALAALLPDEKLSAYARYGLEPMPAGAADEALRNALTKLKGNLLLGVVHSIGKRRDAKALPVLMKMLAGPDQELAKAAASTIGHIGAPESARALQAALPKATGLLRMIIADSALICAERFLADGQRDQALALYTALSGPEIPRPARHGAMAAIVREETSTLRPR